MSINAFALNNTAAQTASARSQPQRTAQTATTDTLLAQPPFEIELRDAQRVQPAQTKLQQSPPDARDRTSPEKSRNETNDGSDRADAATENASNNSEGPDNAHATDAQRDTAEQSDTETADDNGTQDPDQQDTASQGENTNIAIAPNAQTPNTQNGTLPPGSTQAQAAAAGHGKQPGQAPQSSAKAVTAAATANSAASPVLDAANANAAQTDSSDTSDTDNQAKPDTNKPLASTSTTRTNANAAGSFTPTAEATPNTATTDSTLNQPRGIPDAGPRAALANPTADTNATDSDSINQARLSRGLRTALNQQGGAVTLRLTPPEMGTVRIQMQMQGTTVTAQFHAESDAARSMLQQQLGQLRTALESQGLTVDRLGVQSMSNSNASAFNQQSDQQDSQQQSNDGRSRGQYQPQQRGQQDTEANAETPADFTELLTTNNA